MTAGKFLVSDKDARNITDTDPINRSPDAKLIFEEPMSQFKPGQLLFEGSYWPMTPWAPACGILETDKELVLQFELPEVNKEDVGITFVDAAKINAEFARCLLTVKLPKLKEATAKQLDVKVN